jgi:hypothetical protein
MNGLGDFLRHWGLIPAADEAGQDYSKLKNALTAQHVQWQSNADPDYPFVAQVDGKEWKLRLNDYPEEEYAYTLLINGKAAFSFTDMPEAWKYPPE